MNVEQVAIDDLSAEILQELRPVVFAVRQRPDRVALFEELPGGSATGGAGRPGDENHGFRHRSPSFEGCSLLTQQHYACIWIYVRRRKAPRLPFHGIIIILPSRRKWRASTFFLKHGRCRCDTYRNTTKRRVNGYWTRRR